MDLEDISIPDELKIDAGNSAPNSKPSKPWLAQYRFKKGVSGNPNGRPRMPAGLRKQIREMTGAVFMKLFAITLSEANPAASVAAGKIILSYAWGAPETASMDDDPDDTMVMSQLAPQELVALARAKMKRLELVKEPEGQGAD